MFIIKYYQNVTRNKNEQACLKLLGIKLNRKIPYFCYNL